MKFIAKKVKMDFIIDLNNNIIPVTIIKIKFSRIIQHLKTNSNFGNWKLCYHNYYVNFFNPNNTNKLLKMLFKNIYSKKYLNKIKKTIKINQIYEDKNKNYSSKDLGKFISIFSFNKKKDNIYQIQGLSIGKGFAGKIKRYNLKV